MEAEPRVMRFGWSLSLNPLPKVIEEGVRAEKAGFDTIWWLDHTLMKKSRANALPDLFNTLTLLAERTRRIQVGPAVTDVLRHHPAILAHYLATLDRLSGGRVLVGVGAGNITNQVPFGIPTDRPVDRLREGLKVMKRLWNSSSSSPASYEGRFFRLRNASLGTRPLRNLPIYIGAHGPLMLGLASEEGDGWIPHGHTPQSYAKARRSLSEDLSRFGRDPSAFDYCYETPCVPQMATDEDTRPKAVRAGRIGLSWNPQVLLLLAGEPIPKRFNYHEYVTGRLWTEPLKRIGEEKVLETVVWGSAEQMIEQIERFRAAGCRHLILMPHWIPRRLVTESMDLLSKKVLPYFRE